MKPKSKYEEALERAKRGLPIEEIFPELKESEDERIRNEMLNSLKEAEDSIVLTPFKKKSWIAYLERQKEQKPIKSVPIKSPSDEEIIDALLHHLSEQDGILTAIDGVSTKAIMGYLERQKEQKPIISDDAIREGVAHFGITQYQIDNWLKKHVNVIVQKPVEWSEDYSDEDLRTRFAFYTYKDEDDVLYLSNVFVEETSRNKGFGRKILAAAEKVAETIGAISIRLKVKKDSPANAWYRKHGYGYIAFEDGYDWLEKTLEYLKPIKPEWSEEDEKKYKVVLELVTSWANGTIGGCIISPNTDRYIDWFKSLPEKFNLQPKQEWSEEDKEMLDYAIDACDAASDCYSNSQNYVDAAKWLKSLPARFSPQPKKEWSEEDEANFAWFDKFFRAESVVANGRDIPQDKYLWFKSLRPKPYWKPSEGQMDDLSTAEAILREFGYDMVADKITSLRKGLKKL